MYSRGYLGRVAGTEESMCQCFLGCFTQRNSVGATRSKGCFSQEFTRCSLQWCSRKLSKAKMMWAWIVPGGFLPMSSWCKDWCYNECYPEVSQCALPCGTLVGWMGLVWAWHMGLTEVAGCLGHPVPALVCVFEEEGECRLSLSAPPTRREFQQLPNPLAEF